MARAINSVEKVQSDEVMRSLSLFGRGVSTKQPGRVGDRVGGPRSRFFLRRKRAIAVKKLHYGGLDATGKPIWE